jgi:hypothetical protein
MELPVTATLPIRLPLPTLTLIATSNLRPEAFDQVTLGH